MFSLENEQAGMLAELKLFTQPDYTDFKLDESV